MRKTIGFVAFVLTGSILLGSSFLKTEALFAKIILITIGIFYSIGLFSHFKDIKD